MLLDQIKARMFAAMKSGDTVEKEILKVAMGEITTEQARPDRKSGDEETMAILRKMVTSNEESLGMVSEEDRKAVLRREIEILKTFLPQTLSVDAIVAALAPVAAQIKAAGNDGQATGIAVKHLKSTGADAAGKDVSAAVKLVRA
ncbi:MAG: GatB/YqeY domain-containing protein [Myxococcales bacterium]|nr:GatB/YqeY domain-containing protein [Myxococcales bacterium]